MRVPAFDHAVIAALLSHVRRDEKLRKRVIHRIKESFFPNIDVRSAEILAAIERVEALWLETPPTGAPTAPHKAQ